jgi:hypothetical protein
MYEATLYSGGTLDTNIPTSEATGNKRFVLCVLTVYGGEPAVIYDSNGTVFLYDNSTWRWQEGRTPLQAGIEYLAAQYIEIYNAVRKATAAIDYTQPYVKITSFGIEIPSTVQSFGTWEGEAAFLMWDGSLLNTALVSYADITTYESAPNEYTVIIQFEVSGDVLNYLVASTAIIAVCSYAMPVARGQQGTVTTDPTEYLSDFEITTSLDGQSTKLTPPRPTYHIKRCEQLSDGLVGRSRKRKRVQGRISSFRKLELDGGLTESVSWEGGAV